MKALQVDIEAQNIVIKQLEIGIDKNEQYSRRTCLRHDRLEPNENKTEEHDNYRFNLMNYIGSILLALSIKKMIKYLNLQF